MEMNYDGQNRKTRNILILAGILMGIIVLSIACIGFYVLNVLPKSSAQRSAQQATLVAQNIRVMATLTEMARKEMITPTGTPTLFIPYTIDMYGLKLMMPMGWNLQEINRRAEPTGLLSLSLGHDCADYVVTSPDGSARLAIYPPCESSSGTPVLCPADAVSITPPVSDEIIVRYFDKTRGAYLYTQAFEDFSVSSATDILSCYDNPIVASDDVFLHIEFQYIGIESGKDAMLKLVDRIILSIQKR